MMACDRLQDLGSQPIYKKWKVGKRFIHTSWPKINFKCSQNIIVKKCMSFYAPHTRWSILSKNNVHAVFFMHGWRMKILVLASRDKLTFQKSDDCSSFSPWYKTMTSLSIGSSFNSLIISSCILLVSFITLS